MGNGSMSINVYEFIYRLANLIFYKRIVAISLPVKGILASCPSQFYVIIIYFILYLI